MFGIFKKGYESLAEELLDGIEKWMRKANHNDLATFRRAACEAYEHAQSEGLTSISTYVFRDELVHAMLAIVATHESKHPQAWANGWLLVVVAVKLSTIQTSSAAKAELRAHDILTAQF